MSQKNVGVVRRFVGANSGEDLVPLMREVVDRFGPDFPPEPILTYWSEDPAWRYVDPAIEWTSELPGLSQVARGPVELLKWWEGLVEVWDSYVYNVVELRDLGDWVLNIADIQVRGRQGIDVEMRAFELVEVRNGKVVTYRAAFRSEGDALEAAGLQA